MFLYHVSTMPLPRDTIIIMDHRSYSWIITGFDLTSPAINLNLCHDPCSVNDSFP